MQVYPNDGELRYGGMTSGESSQYVHHNLFKNRGKGLPFCYCLVTTKNKTTGGPFHDQWYTKHPESSIPAVLF